VPQTATELGRLSGFVVFDAGAPGKNRTCDLGFRKALLYPTELRERLSFGVGLPRRRGAAELVTFGGPAQVVTSW
jgi:hypothetical protein